MHHHWVDPGKWRACGVDYTFQPSQKSDTQGCGHLHNSTIKYAFQTRSWHEAKFEPVILRTVFRQTDIVWIEHLARIARGQVDSAILSFLESLTRTLPERSDAIRPTRLYTKQNAVATENALELARLSGREFSFQAVDSMCIFVQQAKNVEKRVQGPVRIEPQHLQSPKYGSKSKN
jgi:hypothetical protein